MTMKNLIHVLMFFLIGAPLAAYSFRCGNNPPLFGNLTARATLPSLRRGRGVLGKIHQPQDTSKATSPLFQPKQRFLSINHNAEKHQVSKLRSPTILRGGAVLLTATPPALGAWLPPALLCALAYALYNLFLKKASSSIDPVLGGVLLQIVAAGLGAALLGFQQLAKGGTPLTYSKLGITWAVAAGVAVGMAEIISFIISGMGVPASKSIPTIIGGSVLMGTILGALWLGERMTVRGWFGIVLIAVGIGLVGMDPGSSLH